ncbi:MAG TPA: hypothetical protein VJS38_20505 [Phenylobacterium sp.]|uniref:hypothetical protein n=1 Tax=Phenylobacterium sp. TaxID=1871053 RepID=UPI002B45EFF2|nr:hypothetical protein [Phenylobacterium sp.]HKR90558.1 hypothetical protein [Phenylobacterium sp.]
MRTTGDRATRAAYVAALALGWAAMLVANLPGHLTFDSLLELLEGRIRVRQSWAPAFYAWVLGVFDGVSQGTGLYVAASGLLLFAALASLPWLRGRTSRWAVVAAVLFGLSPLVLIYQAIVWKDVLFANASIAGMICLAWALARWNARSFRIALLLGALLLLGAAALLRQNGIVVGALAAVALGWARFQARPHGGASGERRRWRRGLGWSLGGIIAVVAVSHGMNLATRPSGPPGSAEGMGEGLRMLQSYDLFAAVTLDPDFPLAAVGRAAPHAAATFRSLAPKYYSPERIDFADGQPRIAAAMRAAPAAALAADWRAFILQRPWLYLRARAEAFRWVFLTPRIERCVPVCLGVQGPREVLDDLGMSYRWSAQDERLLRYNGAFLRTPVYSHLAYALLALGVGIALMFRWAPADLAVIALMAGALGFAASFFVISIACDYRYLYFLDLAAMAGLLYVAVDPPGSGGGRARSARKDRV